MSTRHSGTALLACLALLSAGCSGAPDPEADPTQTPTTTASSSPSPSPSETVTPASGKTLDRGAFTMSYPQGWRVDKEATFGLIFADDPHSFSSVSVATADGSSVTLQEERRLQVGVIRLKSHRQPDLDVDGVAMWHYTAKEPTGELVDYLGTLHDQVSVKVTIVTDGNGQERDELVGSVLASWQWH